MKNDNKQVELYIIDMKKNLDLILFKLSQIDKQGHLYDKKKIKKIESFIINFKNILETSNNSLLNINIADYQLCEDLILQLNQEFEFSIFSDTISGYYYAFGYDFVEALKLITK